MRTPLRISGLFTLAIYAAVAWLSFQFQYDGARSERPILGVLALFALACLLYLLSLALIARAARRSGETSAAESDPRASAFRGVLLFSILFRLVLLFSVPIQEVDFYRYLWDGRVLWQGLNPYRFAPAQIDDGGVDAPPELSELAAVRDASGPVKEIFERVHHRQVPTVYPPLAQALFAVCAAITPAAAPLWLHVLLLKLLVLVVDVAILFSMRGLLRQVGMPDAWCLAYGWCPLAIKETANSAHIDGLAVLLVLVTLQLLLKTARSQSVARSSVGPWAVAGGCLGLAILSKTYPVVLLPVVMSFALARIGWRAVVPLIVCVVVVTAGYLPFLDHPAVPVPAADPFSGAPPIVDRQQPWSGLETFLTQWQMNDLLFMVVHENLRMPGDEPRRWFVATSGPWRTRINGRIEASLASNGLRTDVDPAFLLTQVLMGTLVVALSLWWAWQVFRKPEALVLLRSAFLVLAWAWLLSSAQNPWYVLWFLPLMPFARCRSWFLVPCLALLYYLRFWLIYRAAATGPTGECPAFDFGWVWFEHALVLAALAAESALRGRRGWNTRRSGASSRAPSSASAASSAGTSDG